MSSLLATSWITFIYFWGQAEKKFSVGMQLFVTQEEVPIMRWQKIIDAAIIKGPIG